MSTVSHITTADQLLAEADRLGRCELILGELRMMSPAGNEHGKIASRLDRWIGSHVEQHGLGETYAAETGFLLDRNPDTVRAPDFAFVASARLPRTETHKFLPIAPDFCAEVISPSDNADEVIEKVLWWLGHGVRLVWVVDPRTKTVMSYRPGGAAHVYSESDAATLDGVLDGLEIQLVRLFA